MIDIDGILNQLRTERDLIENAMDKLASLAETRKIDLERTKAHPKGVRARAVGEVSEVRTMTPPNGQ